MKTLLSLLIFAVGFGIHAVAQCNNADDYSALRALYLSTDGDNWTNNTGWPDAATFAANPTPPMDTDLSTWFGITCNSNKVEELSLPNNNLNGAIPNEIGLLINLSVLKMDNNSVTGDLSTISPLIKLKVVSFGYTSVDSDLSALISLVDLKEVYLFNTDVVGNLSSLSPLIYLEKINLGGTLIEGDLSALNSLISLDLINLNSTEISGDLESLLGLPSLRILILSDTEVVGSLSSLSMVTSLRVLSLNNTMVIGNLRSLRMIPLVSLDLCDTNVGGNLSFLNILTNLGSLRLSNTSIVGELNSIGSLTNLGFLFLDNLDLSGCWPESFTGICTSLTSYSFDGNQGAISNQGWMDFCTNGAGMCPSNCPDNITSVCLTRGGCSLLSGIYQAKDTVSYDNGYFILAGENVTLNGGEVVSMTNGFEVLAGGVLHIESEGCTNN